MTNLRKLGERRNVQIADLHRHENGCAVRGCDAPTGFKRTVEIRESVGIRGGNRRLVVLGYCAKHLDQILAFKERAAA